MSGFRRYGRKPLKCSVKLLHTTAGEVIAETKDISEEGLFISCPEVVEQLAVGETVNAEFCTEDASRRSDRAQLKVVRRTKDGVGFSFA